MWATAVVDIRALRELSLPGADRVHVTALLDGQPVGAWLVPVKADRLPAAVLRDMVLSRASAELHHAAVAALRPVPTRGRRPTTSVLVCTRDRPEDLARCLHALRSCRNSVDEIVVVDNGSRSPRTETLARAAGARYVREPEPGLDRARNRGFSVAQGELVLCTDDDVAVAPGWADELVRCFDDPLVMAATGLVLPAVLDTPARQQFELHAAFGKGMRRRTWDGTAVAATSAGDVGAGASMAFRASWVRSIGGFPEELDAGMPTRSGGDTYAFYRVLRDGLRVLYEPRALAFHHHRSDEAALGAAVSGYGTGTFSYLAHAWYEHRDPAVVRAGVRWAARRAVREPLRSLLGRPGALAPWLLAQELRGSLAAVRAYPAARRQVAVRPSVVLGPAVTSVARGPEPGLRAHVAAELPPLTVVIPSRGRRELVSRLLSELDRQDYPHGRCDVVVALDGDVDGSAGVIRGLSTQLTTTVLLLQPPGRERGLGAGAARNAGAQQAKGRLLLFLDDDVEPIRSDLLIAHARRHADAAAANALVVGSCAPRDAHLTHRHGQMVRNWWVEHSAAAAADGARLGFADVLTGNLSCSAASFAALGGFAALPRREDWEFGHRALSAGFTVHAAPDAAVLHDADYDLRSAVADRRSEGAGDGAFARSCPSVAGLLPLGAWLDLRPPISLALSQLLWSGRRDLDPILSTGARWTERWEAVGSHRAFLRTYAQTMRLAYWSGVASVLASEAELLALLMTADGGDRTDLPRVDLEDLDATAPAAPPLFAGDVTVWLAGRPVGRVPLRLGGFPWRRDLFVRRVLDRYADEMLRSATVAGIG